MEQLSNEGLMWLSIGIWLVMIAILAYYAFFGTKSATKTLPSGNTADMGNLESSS